MMIKFFFRWMALAVIVLMPFFINAQNRDLGNWMIYFGNKPIGDRWNIHHELQYRNYSAIADLEQLLLRTGLGYNLTEKNNNLLLGYGFIASENLTDAGDDKVTTNEHRVFQQFINRQSRGRLAVQHRFRFEQRILGREDFRLRARYFLALNIAINNKSLMDKTWYGSLYNEIFINGEGDWFDRNRVYTGLGFRVNNHVRFELGYMNQFVAGSDRDQINMIVFYTFK